MKRILGLLGWLGVALVVAAVVIRFTKPEWQVSGYSASQVLALGGLVVTLLYAASQWRDIGRSFQGKAVRYGSITAGSVLAFLGILIAINYIGSRQNKRWDLTAAGQFSLSDQTKKLLGSLDKPLTIKAFYDPTSGGQLQAMRDRFGEFKYISNQVSVEYVDAVKDPLAAKAADVTQYGTIVMGYNGRTEKVTSTDESELANGLKKLIEGKAKKAYFIQGHGEHDMDGTDKAGYSAIRDALKSDNFDVAKLTLAQQGKVPDDATVVVIGGPTHDYLPAEVDALRGFLRRGGKMFLMIDPPDKADAPQPVSLIALAHEWGINVGNDIIIDVSAIGQQLGTGPSVPIAMPATGGHAITQNFQYVTAYPVARSVTPVEGGTDGKFAQSLLVTSPQSWAETDLKGLFATSKPEKNLDKGDKAGPVSIAAAASAAAPDAPAATPDAPKPESRVVVVGDSDFLSNEAINFQGNRDLALNMANWLAQQENLIAIHPRAAQDRRITLTQDQSDRLFWLTIFIIPGLLLANGVRVWWRRR